MKSRIWLWGVGLAFLGNAGAVSGPKLPPLLAPAQVTDLRVAAVGDTLAVLQWTEVPSNTTVAARYAIRFGLDTNFVWWKVPDVTRGGCGAPVYGSTPTGGRLRSCVVSWLIPNTGYKFQLVAYTGVLGSTAIFGPLSNIAADTTDGIRTKVGPLVVIRMPLMRDTFNVQAAWFSAYPDTFPLRGSFNYGSYTTIGFGANGSVVARGYLLVVKP